MLVTYLRSSRRLPWMVYLWPLWRPLRQLGLVDPLPKWWILLHISCTSASVVPGSLGLCVSLFDWSVILQDLFMSWLSYSMMVSRSCTCTWQPLPRGRRQKLPEQLRSTLRALTAAFSSSPASQSSHDACLISWRQRRRNGFHLLMEGSKVTPHKSMWDKRCGFVPLWKIHSASRSNKTHVAWIPSITAHLFAVFQRRSAHWGRVRYRMRTCILEPDCLGSHPSPVTIWGSPGNLPNFSISFFFWDNNSSVLISWSFW